MMQRIDLSSHLPQVYRAMGELEQAIANSGIDPALYELVKIRASQINACAFCLDMHLRDARKGGESQRRLDVLSAWREAPSLFTEGERAALALTEEVTLIHEHGVSDKVWSAAMMALGEDGTAQVIAACVIINGWNRMAISGHQDLPENP